MHIRRVVGAKVALALLLEASGRAPVDIEGLLDGGLDLGGLDAVAVYFDHVAAAAEQDIVAVFVLCREVPRVVDAVYEGLRRLLGEIDVTAHIGIRKAELAGLAVGDLFSVLADERDLRLHLGLADGAGLVGLVDLEKAHGKAALAACVDVDEVEVFVIEVVGGLAAHEQHAQEGAGVIADLAHIGRGQECDGDALGEEELRQRRRVFNGRIGHDIVLAAVDIQSREDDDDGGDEVHRGQGRKSVLLGEGYHAVDADGVDGALEIAVFVQHALGVSCRAGGIDRVGRVMLVRVLVAL